MSKPNNLENRVKQVKDYLKKIKKLAYVNDLYLIGSRAKGTHKRTSDWDVWVHTKFPVVNFHKVYGRVEGYNIDFVVSDQLPDKEHKKL